MSEKESDVFVEKETEETKMAYDDGGVPFYVAAAWVLFLVAYVVVMAMVSLPDLRAWSAR